jgi:endonuclease III
MTLKEKYRLTFEYFKLSRPVVETELGYNDPFQLIVAVILSAQCTDKRVNIITPALLERFPDAAAMSDAAPEDIFPFIKSCTYPNNKSKHLANMAKMLISEFGGKVPSDPEELQKLPGVGRKTANVIASVIYDKPVIAVDTHVFRVANRIGLVKAANPRQAEDQLSANISESMMHNAHHWLILHGRYVCKARTPLCGQCGLKDICDFYNKNIRNPVKLKEKNK